MKAQQKNKAITVIAIAILVASIIITLINLYPEGIDFKAMLPKDRVESVTHERFIMSNKPSEPVIDLNKPNDDPYLLSDNTYVPLDIKVSTNTEERAAVSFTHLDGVHYVLYFNEDKGESNENQ